MPEGKGYKKLGYPNKPGESLDAMIKHERSKTKAVAQEQFGKTTAQGKGMAAFRGLAKAKGKIKKKDK